MRFTFSQVFRAFMCPVLRWAARMTSYTSSMLTKRLMPTASTVRHAQAASSQQARCQYRACQQGICCSRHGICRSRHGICCSRYGVCCSEYRAHPPPLVCMHRLPSCSPPCRTTTYSAFEPSAAMLTKAKRVRQTHTRFFSGPASIAATSSSFKLKAATTLFM